MFKVDMEIALRKRCSEIAGVTAIGERYDNDTPISMTATLINPTETDYGKKNYFSNLLLVFLCRGKDIREAAEPLSKIYQNFVIEKNDTKFDGVSGNVYYQLTNFRNGKPPEYFSIDENAKQRVYKMEILTDYSYQID